MYYPHFRLYVTLFVAFVCLATRVPAALASDTYAGVDFYAADHLRMPQYDLCRNLVQNPGFEQGFNYWHWGPLGKMNASRYKEYYDIDEKGGVNGGRCLKIRGEAGQETAHLATSAIPIVTGENYTLSFYAKTDSPNVTISSLLVWAGWAFPERSFPLSTDWKRYSFTFKAGGNVIAPDFGPCENSLHRSPSADCIVWLDNVQLERGPMTDYVEKPIGARLLTAERGNLLTPSERANAAVEVKGKPRSTGSAHVTVTTHAGAVVFKGAFPFDLGAPGIARLPQPWADKVGVGLYTVEIDVETKDGFTDREFARFARMPDASGTYPNKSLFAFGGVGARTGDWERRLKFYQRIGLGSSIHFDPQPAEYRRICQECGIFSLSSIFDSGDHMLGWNLKDDFREHANDADLALIEAAAYKKAAACPDITYWKLINEPDGTRVAATRKLITDVAEMKKYLPMLAAARRGILRANPHAVIITPDGAGMTAAGGLSWLQTFIEAGGMSIADIVAIHPYRARPEDPDLDADTAALFKSLDAHGYHGDVWYTEGGGNSNLQIPAYQLDVYKTLGEDTYRAGMLTYDIGWAERLSAAYCERQWLIGLKYRQRLKQYVDWYISGNSILDINFTPGVIAFVPATLDTLLGDATYVRDISLGENLRGYAFRDVAGRPVAALWTTDLAGDHGEKTGPTLRLDKLPKGYEAFDMLGASIDISNAKLSLGPLPVFIRGAAGTVTPFCDAIESAPMLAGGNRLRMWPEAQSATSATLNVLNPTRTPVVGSLTIAQSGQTPLTQRINLAPGNTLALPIVAAAGAHGVSVTVTYKPDDGGDPQVSTVDVPLMVARELSSAVKIDGDLSEWAGVAPIPVTNTVDFSPAAGVTPVPYHGPTDLSATLKMAWDSDNLYFAVHVTDDVFHLAPQGSGAYNGDSLQIYFDSFGDARSRKELGFNGDDQSFTLRPDPAGATLDRTQAPDWQIAFAKNGPIAGAKIAVKQTVTGYDIEAAIPATELVPLRLKAGNVFGFAVLVNDNDGDYRKRGVTLTPPGTEPFGRPDLYPVVVLTR